jgi:hypothetical protein
VLYGEFQPLIDENYRQQVLRARQMTPEEKFLAGEELFMAERKKALAEIKSQNPKFSEEDCRRELERRLELQERLEWEEVMNRQRRQGQSNDAEFRESNQTRPQSEP